MAEKKNILKDGVRNNRAVLIVQFSISMVMLVYSLIDMIRNQGNPLYFLLQVLTAIAPLVAGGYYWKKDPSSEMIKHSAAVGFGIFAIITVVTGTNAYVLFFIIPMMMIISVYCDPKYCLRVGIGVVALTTITIGSGLVAGYMDWISAMLIFCVNVLACIYCPLAAKITSENIKVKNDHILEVARATKDGIAGVNKGLEYLNESAKATGIAMIEVGKGTSQTADAVQNQLLQTQAISDRAELVNASAGAITDVIEKTVSCVSEGNKDMTELVDKVEKSVDVSNIAVDKLSELKDSTRNMKNIVKFIDDIAFQTNILALNANVEAARAGEAGRGFAVVAGEVSAMSDQTKEATEKIQTLLGSVQTSIDEVVSVMEEMIKGINEEKESTERTLKSFEAISDNTTQVKENAESLVDHLRELTGANNVIIDSIQTISSVSEEVSALAQEAIESERKNAESVQEISDNMSELMDIVMRSEE
ncbi:MAG: hypothetical protein J6033_05385 [Lachnospiraceae bacterium]|nr:hypothetical protein [Lachnospiraceae bacterium]